ncbi:TPA: hypothetical protein MED93_005039 [Klebsiella pneumoniae]|nr:hypothetical protein [Klebsiella pneumoniae]
MPDVPVPATVPLHSRIRIHLYGTTCLQLKDAGGIRRIKEGDPLQVASWYQTCFDAGLPVIVQVNESRD